MPIHINELWKERKLQGMEIGLVPSPNHHQGGTIGL